MMMRGMESRAAEGRTNNTSFNVNRFGWTVAVLRRQDFQQTGGKRRRQNTGVEIPAMYDSLSTSRPTLPPPPGPGIRTN